MNMHHITYEAMQYRHATCNAGARLKYRVWGGGELRAWRAREREPITEVWGQSPQRGPGTEPLVGDQGGKASLELKTF